MKLTNKQKRVIAVTRQIASLLTDEEVERLAYDAGTLTIVEAAASVLGYQLIKKEEPTDAEDAFLNYALDVMDKVLYADDDEAEEKKG